MASIQKSSQNNERIQGSITADELLLHPNPALNRLALRVEVRSPEGSVNYSRMHNRHNRSHSRG